METISFLMPAYNEAKILPRTLSTLRQHLDYLKSHGVLTEVIVCNNHSTDETHSIASSYGAQVVYEPINQISRARNRAAAAAKGDWFVFLDAIHGLRAKKLAQIKSKRWDILTSYPILTSSRKMHLYSFGERLKQFFKLVWVSGKPVKKEDCDLWYDGRR